jgi:hypothetical protein
LHVPVGITRSGTSSVWGIILFSTVHEVEWKKNRDGFPLLIHRHKLWNIYIYIYIYIYTGRPRRNVPDLGRVFLMVKYTDITQNTYVQSWTVTKIMAREVCNFDSCYAVVHYQRHIKTVRNMWFLYC